MNALIVIMGVSGCGKSTIGSKLSAQLSAPFLEGDDFHPKANIEKMTRGEAMTDEDRAAWLDAIAAKVSASHAPLLVLACSALTPYVQTRLRNAADREITWVWLSAPKSIIEARLKARESHFMPASLLGSQLDALSPPKDALKIDVSTEPQNVVSTILQKIGTL